MYTNIKVYLSRKVSRIKIREKSHVARVKSPEITQRALKCSVRPMRLQRSITDFS